MDRLDGWKRIAQHLNRDVRTLRRWELNEGLPVHRLMHDRQGTVYAYRSELDAWRAQRGEASVPAPKPKKKRMRGKPGPRWAWLSLPLLMIGVLAVNFWPEKSPPAIAFGEWDWVLITDFDNRTGEDVLDGTVEYALVRELSNSSFVKVVTRERINDALALMKLPPDSEIDVAIGREISLRDGGIRILLSGRVDKIGNAYLLSTDLINPLDGVTFASFSADVTDQDQILAGIRSLSKDVRSALGEGLQMIEATDLMLKKVTTPSLQALQLFSEADRIMAGSERSRALTILQEAIRLDPDFASAHLLLSYLFGDRQDGEMQRQHLERAVALAETASERERLFILATYYGYLQDHQKSIEIYELITDRYPDHFWANGNLSNFYEMEGRFEEAMRLRVRVSESRPNSISWYPDMDALQFGMITGDREVSGRFYQRIAAVKDQPGFEWARTLLIVLPVHELLAEGDLEGALREVESLVAGMEQEDLVSNGFLYAHIRSVYLALGRVDRFLEVNRWRSQPGWFEALLRHDQGDSRPIEQYVESAETNEWLPVLLAFTGRTDAVAELVHAEETYRFLQPPFSINSWMSFARGQAALSDGRLDEAIVNLDREILFLNVTHKWAYLFGKHSLAMAYEQRGERDQAIRALEEASVQKPLAIFETAGVYLWQRNQYYLQKLYLANGQTAAAQRVRQELREALRLADPGHHFLQFEE